MALVRLEIAKVAVGCESCFGLNGLNASGNVYAWGGNAAVTYRRLLNKIVQHLPRIAQKLSLLCNICFERIAIYCNWKN